MIENVYVGLILSILLGALIGAQREVKQQKLNKREFAGFRTFTFISLLGYLLGVLSLRIFESYILIFIGFFGVFTFIISSYIVYYINNKKFGESITGHIGALLTFIIGILISLDYYYISILIAVAIATILFLGDSLHRFARNLNDNEIFATLKFVIISIIILPIIPNKNFGPLDVPLVRDFLINGGYFSESLLNSFAIFNFFEIWLMVVLISGISYFGYILIKTVGARKGIVLTGLLGGIMSSTATMSSFAKESKRFNNLSNPLIAGVIIASSIMFFRVLFEVAIFNPSLLFGIYILFFMGLIGLCVAVYIILRERKNHNNKIEAKSPFDLIYALKFGVFFLVVIFVSKLFALLFGNLGVYFVAFFSGFVDVDVVVLTFSNMALDGIITNSTAQIAIFIAAIANTMFKIALAYFLGSKIFFKKVIIILGLIILGGGIFYFFI